MMDFNMQQDVNLNINNDKLDLDPRVAMRVSNSMQKRKSFGKAWEVGDQGTVFVPFRWYADASTAAGGSFVPHFGALFGHQVSVSPKEFGTSFVPSMAQIDVNGQVIGNGDLAFQFSLVAPLIVRAQKEAELAALNKKDWTLLGNSAYQDARAKIENKYDPKNNMEAVRPVLGRLCVRKLTEVVYVAMDPNSGTPIFENDRNQKTGVYVQELSNSRMEKLRTLANDANVGILAQNPGLTPVENEIYFLEVVYNFTSSKNNRSEAGRADPQGVAHSITLLARNPQLKDKLDEYKKLIPATGAEMRSHAYGTQKMDENTLKRKFQSIMFEAADSFPYMMEEDKNRLVKHADLLDYLRIVPASDPELCNRLSEALGHPIGQATTTTAPTLDSILKEGDPDFSKQSDDASASMDNVSSDSMDSGEEGSDLPFTLGI